MKFQKAISLACKAKANLAFAAENPWVASFAFSTPSLVLENWPVTILVCSNSIIRGGRNWFPAQLGITNFQTLSLWWSSSFSKVVIWRCCLIYRYKHVSQLEDKLQKWLLILFWDALLCTMMTVQDPCIYFAYVNAVPKYLDVPSTGFHSDTVQCNKHVCQVDTTHSFIVFFDHL